RPFTGARSHAVVLDARIRNMTGHLPPRTGDSWTANLPKFADPELGRYMAEVAAAMDDRQRRIGEHAAQERPLWATQALGQVPARRRAYEAETSWAPKHVAEELRAARKQEQFSKVEATRHAYEAAAAGRHGSKEEMAALHQQAADSWAALGQRATLVRDQL